MKRKIAIALVALAFVFTSAGLGEARDARGPGARGGHGPRGGHGATHFNGRPAVQPHREFRGPAQHPSRRGFVGRWGFDGHRRFQGDRHIHRGNRSGIFVGVTPFVLGGAYAYGWPYDTAPAPVYSAPAPSYWYYCQSAGAYYPDVPSCPEAWVPVPAQ
jgi:hypothetical protein